MFDYVDGGAEDEVTLRANRAALERVRFRARTLVDVSRRRLDVSIFGKPAAMPAIVGPMGLLGLSRRHGDLEMARVAGVTRAIWVPISWSGRRREPRAAGNGRPEPASKGNRTGLQSTPFGLDRENVMSNPLDRYSEHLFALLRIVAGLLFACHGAQKLLGAFGGHLADTPLLKLAGVIEFAGGLLIAAGLFAAPVAFLASGEMAVAYFKAHAPHSFLPIVNKGELAVVYCFLFLYIAARGSGPYGLGRLLGGARAPRG